MKTILKQIREKLFKNNETISEIKLNSQLQKIQYDEQIFFQFLASYLDYKYFPLSAYTISPIAIRSIFNDLLYRPIGKILELGSGLSTVAIAKFIIKENLSTQLYCVESDGHWLNLVRNYLGEDGKDSRIHLIHAPLVDSPYQFKEHKKWFDVAAIKSGIPPNMIFDLFLVDGPVGYQVPQSRYGFYPFVEQYIGDNAIVYIDDSNRPDEEELANLISEKYKMKKEIIGLKTTRLFKI